MSTSISQLPKYTFADMKNSHLKSKYNFEKFDAEIKQEEAKTSRDAKRRESQSPSKI